MHYEVFIFAGQSNMQGGDSVINPASPTLDLVTNGTQTAADAAALFATGAPYVTAPGDIRGHQGTQNGSDNVAGVPIKVHGPEVGFNRTLHAKGVTPTYILKWSTNFTAYESGVSPWTPGKTKWVAWQAWVDERLAALTAAGDTYRVAGFCWHQGIDDGLLQRTQAAYEADLRAIITGLRTKFGAGLPFVMARSINSTVVGQGLMRPIRDGQLAVAEDQGNAWVDSDDLAPYVNNHHMLAPMQLIQGQRMALKYLTLAAPWRPAMPSRRTSGAVKGAAMYQKQGGVLVPRPVAIR